MTQEGFIELTRDCDAIQVPYGITVKLARGTPVRITQQMGGFTAVTDYGNMVRIDETDADALGLTAAPAGEVNTGTDVPLINMTADEVRDQVWDRLRTVFDPEIPVNVVDLGLVYKNDVIPLPQGGFDVFIEMTLTAPGCGMGPVLQADALYKVKHVPGVKQVKVDIVFDPPWTRERMSEAARLELGL
jgi:probable FeS assembly SUF system protein SufT